MQLVVQAPAKVNLYLRILGRRVDGYHQLETVMQTLELSDQIILTDRPAGVTLQCDDSRLPTGPDNLACQAAFLLALHAPGHGVHINLKKRIPWQAGLGGGSSDAAAVLLGLNRLWQLYWPQEKLSAIASELGSDVPFFLYGGAALASGRGELITPLPSRLRAPVALVIPPFGLSTAAVYRDYSPGKPAAGGWQILAASLVDEDLDQLADQLFNDLERPAFNLRPELAELKANLRRQGYPTLLCGSGSSMLALLDERKERVDQLAKLLPMGYRLISTRFAGSTEE
jgi:4-diphosphocytidyl-2-C-methyl-D-erythritol kinase